MRSLILLFRRRFAIRLITGFAGAAALLTIMGFWTAKSHSLLPYFDHTIQSNVQSYSSASVTAAFRFITLFGSTRVLFAIGVLAVGIFLYLRRLSAIGVFLLSMAGQIVLHIGFKAIFLRERPDTVLDYAVIDSPSFPSGHALASATFYGILAFLFTQGIRSTAAMVGIWSSVILVVLLIGISRIYFGVHYPTDVLAGYFAAIVWTTAVASSPRTA